MTATWGYDPTLRRWCLADWTTPERGKLPPLAGEPLASYDAVALAAIPPQARQTVARNIQLDAGQFPPAHIFDGAPDAWQTMTCPRCWCTSFNPDNAGARYCDICEWWTGSPNHGPHPDDLVQAARDATGIPGLVDVDELAADIAEAQPATGLSPKARVAVDFGVLLELLNEPLSFRDYEGAYRAVIDAGFKKIPGGHPDEHLGDIIVSNYLTDGRLYAAAAGVLGAGFTRGDEQQHDEQREQHICDVMLETIDRDQRGRRPAE